MYKSIRSNIDKITEEALFRNIINCNASYHERNLHFPIFHRRIVIVMVLADYYP